MLMSNADGKQSADLKDVNRTTDREFIRLLKVESVLRKMKQKLDQATCLQRYVRYVFI